MDALFLKIFNMSITAGWLILAVVALRFFLKKAPGAVCCALWGIVGIRLILPFSLKSALSLIPTTETVPADIGYMANPTIHSGVSFINSSINPILSESLAATPQNSINPMQILLFFATWIWIFGMVGMLLYAAISYFRLWRRVRESIPLREKIRLCDHIDTPFILGILRPRIYLPSAMGEEDAAYVIAHETAHLTRRDHLWKPLGFLLLTVYWFHPLMWVAYILLCRDIEVACDQKVIQKLGTDIKRPYSETLLRCSVSRRIVSACPLAFGEVSVKSRIKGILHYKKPAFWLIVTAVLICTAVAVCFLTDPLSNGTRVTDLTSASGTRLLEGEGETVLFHRGDYSYPIERTRDMEKQLKGIRVNPEPIQTVEANMIINPYFSISIEGGARLHFNREVTACWLNGNRSPFYIYKIENPEYAWKLLEGYIPSFYFYPDSGEPAFSGSLTDGSQYFFAKVKEIHHDTNSLTVSPIKSGKQSVTAESVRVLLPRRYAFITDFQVGHSVCVIYDTMAESYPPQIFGTKALPIVTATFLEIPYVNPMYDAVSFDMDGDGTVEICSVGPGSMLSSMYTFTVSAQARGETVTYKSIYKNTFMSNAYEGLEFIEKDGQYYLKGWFTAQNSMETLTDVFEISVSEGHIVLTAIDFSTGFDIPSSPNLAPGKTLTYWGRQGVEP